MAGRGISTSRRGKSRQLALGCCVGLMVSMAGLTAGFLMPAPTGQQSRQCRRSCGTAMKAAGSAFDNLGMPTIRPRGSKDEQKPAEEAPAVAEVAPVRKVPELITMNAFGLLIEPTDELGLFMREVLMKHFDYTVRLPRPDLFTTAFDAAYEARKREFPNFGAGTGMTSEEWWAPIFYKTFLDLGMPKEDVDDVFVGVFEELYYDSLASDWAWEPVEDILPMLDKLQEWRMEGGPKLGVIVDFDERLPTILENLDMAHYFDVVVSSREAGAAKPDPTPFKLAMEKAGVKDASRVMHLGTDFDRDVVGAAKAGVEPIWVVTPSYDVLEPEQEALQLQFGKIGDLEAVLDMYGKSDPERLVTTTYKNKNRNMLNLRFEF